MFDNSVEAITRGGNEGKKIKGTVLLMKKSVLDFDDLKASVLDGLHELLGNKVSLQLISAVNGDPGEFLHVNLHILLHESCTVIYQFCALELQLVVSCWFTSVLYQTLFKP